MNYPAVKLARNAMATRFEIVLPGERGAALRAAGEEALDEIDRLEGQLSLYQTGTEIAQVNARAAWEAVRVSPPVFNLLKLARKIFDETQGAFDVTIAPLVRCWGFMGGSGTKPLARDLAAARKFTGMDLVVLDEKECSVRFQREGVMIDLGAIGKGYAIERAANLLLEAGITSALIHGGTSSVYAIGHPPDDGAWKISVDLPPQSEGAAAMPLTVIPLKDESLSVSAVWGKCFKAGGKTFGHIIDPRTGQPTAGGLLAAIVLPSATESDAFTTALLIEGVPGFKKITGLRPGMKALVVSPGKSAGKPIIRDNFQIS
jgi:thiamine biosynthesis lipoprotein